jgi:Rv2525c-like, glycoside hydrolase-like domain
MRRGVAALAVAAALTAGVVACAPTKTPAPGGSGAGFDTCDAPSTGAMSAWLQSPYRFVGVYIGGGNAACKAQPNLTAGWVNTVHSWGYGLIPTYVGLQAWCTFAGGVATMSGNLQDAQTQGVGSAGDAVNRAQARGLGPGTPIYFDLEAYDSSNGSCVDAVTAFMSGWIAGLHNQGYPAAMYSSAASGVRDMANVQNNPPYQLDAIWFAHWNGDPSLYGDPYFSDSVWQGARIHQYQGGHDESWGGVDINIDNDSVGGPTG